MLREIDIDNLVNQRDKGFDTRIYYVCNNAELPEVMYPRDMRKSANEYSVIECKLFKIENALNEYENMLANRDSYETYTVINFDVMDAEIKYKGYEFLRNPYSDYQISPRVYGYRTTTYYNIDDEVSKREIPSIVLNEAKYTNTPTYLGKQIDATDNTFTSLYGWKYKLLDEPVSIGNVLYKYKYTDYYTLYIDDWHLKEYPLINVNEKNCFFLSPSNAYEYLKQMRS